jgi:RNA-binding protein
MKFLGNSLHVANSGKLIARSDKTPSPGAIVYDSKKKIKLVRSAMYSGQQKSPIFLFVCLDQPIEMKLRKTAVKNYLYRNRNPKSLEKGG